MPEESKKKQNTSMEKYKNVLLTDEEIKQLREKLPNDWEKWIETFSEGLELKGYKYNNHYLAILQWEERNRRKETGIRKSKFNNYIDTNKTDYEGLEKKLLDNMLRGTAMIKFTISGRLPSLNDYINVCRHNKYKAAAFKKRIDTQIISGDTETSG